MTLGEILAHLASADDGAMIYARRPWTAESDACLDGAAAAGTSANASATASATGAAAPAAGAGHELFCSIADARDKVRLYVQDPIAMQVARLAIHAESLRRARACADVAARTFAFDDRPVGYFTEAKLSGPGRYHFTPFRGEGHLRLIGELEKSGFARCSLPDGTSVVVVAIPDPWVIELGNIEPSTTGDVTRSR